MMNTKLKVEQAVFSMPKDKQGYFHRYGVKDLEQYKEEDMEKVLSTIYFVEKLVNVLQIQRKTGFSWGEAEDYWQKWRKSLPWEGSISAPDCSSSVLLLEDLNENYGDDFLKNLPEAQLFQRDKQLQQLGWTLFDYYQDIQEVSIDLDDIGHLFLKYVVYAIKELLRCWDTSALEYVAPLYRTSSFEEESFGQLSQFYFSNFCYPEEILSVYSTEKKEIVRGFYDLEGNFQMREDGFQSW